MASSLQAPPPSLPKPDSDDGLAADLAQSFKLLSDETRPRILMLLAEARELHVSALCEQLGQSQPAVSHHLALLRVAGLIRARRHGKHNFYTICASHFHGLLLQLLSSEGAETEPGTELRFGDFVLVYRPKNA